LVQRLLRHPIAAYALVEDVHFFRQRLSW
jgi:hypothetical protein